MRVTPQQVNGQSGRAYIGANKGKSKEPAVGQLRLKFGTAPPTCTAAFFKFAGYQRAERFPLAFARVE